jgi:hypothetical protein
MLENVALKQPKDFKLIGMPTVVHPGTRYQQPGYAAVARRQRTSTAPMPHPPQNQITPPVYPEC